MYYNKRQTACNRIWRENVYLSALVHIDHFYGFLTWVCFDTQTQWISLFGFKTEPNIELGSSADWNANFFIVVGRMQLTPFELNSERSRRSTRLEFPEKRRAYFLINPFWISGFFYACLGGKDLNFDINCLFKFLK